MAEPRTPHAVAVPRARTAAVTVTAVIVTHNSGSHLARCVDLLRASDSVGRLQRIVVVDNGSRDDPADLLKDVPFTQVVCLRRNAGYAAAINIGAALAGEKDALLVLNPDAGLQAGALDALAIALSQPRVGIVVPRLVDETGALQPSLRREPTALRAWGEALLGGNRAGRVPHLGELVVSPADYVASHVVDWATGAVMLISAECRRSIGPWDESFLLYSEETDYALRARDAGWSVTYIAEATAVHKGGESNSSPFLWSLLCVNRIRLFRKRHAIHSTLLFACGVFANEALRALSGRPTARAALKVLTHPSRWPTSLPEA